MVLNQLIDQDTAELLVTEFGHNIVRVSDSDIDLAIDLCPARALSRRT